MKWHQKAFEKASDLIKKYPNCDELIYWISVVLRIYLLGPQIEEKDKYERAVKGAFKKDKTLDFVKDDPRIKFLLD
ncbi:hypothetical protein [Clostridium estertheticum]|uniref:hypothetical protein n=1 Tax=Clostridium estertheticum TaxID=238834 RepID=UPI00209A88D7|nr:hypothetical protein [Clostridium estertheticum]